MIKKLRVKFIALSMAALFVLLAVILTAVNVYNYKSVLRSAGETLDILESNRGTFPVFMHDGKDGPERDGREDGGEGSGSRQGGGPGDFDDLKRRGMSPEMPYESRFFSLLVSGDGRLLQADLDRITAVGAGDAGEYAEKALASGKTEGFVGDYRFRISGSDPARIIFLDCGRSLGYFRSFLGSSLAIGFAGYALFFFVILYFSERMVRPVAESYEKQKRFITDAGHEIKTPLTIIRADADVLEADLGEGNEWLEDIQKQTERLASLTNDLVYLSRMEEDGGQLTLIDIPFSEVVTEAVSYFETAASAQGRELSVDVRPMLTVKGDEKALTRLVSILMDNAMKYSPENGRIAVKAFAEAGSVKLSVFNETASPVEKEGLERLFERFYRSDPSRNSETGGHGIGLSMAKAITEAHRGRIKAETGDGSSLTVTVSLPQG